MAAIVCENLTKRYKDTVAVDGLQLSVAEGELFSLLGVNGAGKTTTVKMLCGLLSPSEGDAFLHGYSVRTEGKAVKSLVGVSPQETAVAPNLTARENLAFLGGVYGFTKEKRAQRIEELSLQLGLDSVLDKRAGKLSGGWQRRLSIAMALFGEPKILFLDEPTLGLDVLARADLWALIKGLKGKMTVLLTTHYMEEAAALSDRVGIMQSGKLAALGTVAQLKAQTGTERLEEAFICIAKGVRV